MNPFDFTGRHVFVSGGTSGINLGIAEAFAAHGANVAVMSRSQEKVDAAVAALKRTGAKAAGRTADVRDPAAVAAALAAALGEFGEIDVLVSGAAGNFPAAALGMSPNGFKAVVDIDLLGSFNVLRSAHHLLKKPGASIINVSAPQAMHAQAMQAHVCAAKAGVDMLTRVLAIEWGGDGIRVNSIIPGPIADTEGMARLAPTPEAMEAARKSVPLRRFGEKREVAELALFLASPLASYITGAIIPVDGGLTAAGPRMLAQALAAAW
ncbi:MAG TPA: SDR family oxidoreductase [Xanthobacteraceae bacterium]|nr:SDR family oxidoreductase [Xanthobacteraceae bacterium]